MVQVAVKDEISAVLLSLSIGQEGSEKELPKRRLSSTVEQSHRTKGVVIHLEASFLGE